MTRIIEADVRDGLARTKRALVVNCSSPHYNLGAAKLSNWLRRMGWQVTSTDGDPGLFMEPAGHRGAIGELERCCAISHDQRNGLAGTIEVLTRTGLGVGAMIVQPSLGRFASATNPALTKEGFLMISCQCGCGTNLQSTDARGRPRVFISGHNLRLAPSRKYTRLPVAERFWPKVDRRGSDECWEWTAYRDKATGYGRFPPEWAHRVSYKLTFGDIPTGLEIDHLCRNRACVNPSHLEAVPHAVNAHRGEAPTMRAHRENRCIRGHAVTPDNTYFDKDGGRRCRVCVRLHAKNKRRIAAAVEAS